MERSMRRSMGSGTLGREELIKSGAPLLPTVLGSPVHAGWTNLSWPSSFPAEGG